MAPKTVPRRRGPYIILIILMVASASIAWWVESNRRSLSRETSTAKEIEQLGAIVVMDANRRHPASINLSPLQSPASLAKALEFLQVLKHLTSLDASRTPIRDDQLRFLGDLTSLNSLSLNSTDISDEGLQQLSRLTNLQTLHLASTQVTDRGLPLLKSLNNLRILDISATDVSADLEPLTTLPQLEWLVLRELTLSDDALLPLRSCPSLRRLSLENSQYQVESLETLNAALPELSIDR